MPTRQIGQDGFQNRDRVYFMKSYEAFFMRLVTTKIEFNFSPPDFVSDVSSI